MKDLPSIQVVLYNLEMMTANTSLVYPLFAMFLLTALVLAKMFKARVKAVQSGQVKMSYFKTYSSAQDAGPDEMIQVSRHFVNLFEAPVLFYLVCVLAMILPVSESLFMVLAWLYVFARALHAFVHLGSNKVILRMRIYGVSWLILTSLWVIVLWKAIVISRG